MDKSPNICFVSIGANGSAITADMIAAGIEMSCFDPWPSHVESIQKEGLLIKLPDEHKIQSIPIYHLCQLAESSHPFDIIFKNLFITDATTPLYLVILSNRFPYQLYTLK